MADSLRRLVNNESCRMLSEKLENWYKDYHINSCDQNLNCCCEMLELNSKIQGQLFTILNLIAQEGGHYAGVEIIKSRFLPWLGTCFSNTTITKSTDGNLILFQDKQLRELSATREREIQQLDSELNSTRVQLNMVQQDLRKTKMDLEDVRTRSATALLAAEDEILHLRLKTLQSQEEARKRSFDMLTDYERQLRNLKDEIAVLTAEKSALQNRCSRSPSPCRTSYPSRPDSPVKKEKPSLETSIAIPTNKMTSNATRKACLLDRFSDAYAYARLEAQNLLKQYIDRLETIQRIIYIATVESFHVAKLAFIHFKVHVKKCLTPSHGGPEALENAVMDYTADHLDLYDVQHSVNDVICAMNMNPKISFPPQVDYKLIDCFIREMCYIAFAMQTLEPPLDIAFGADGEVFNDCKYRRSCDSDFTAPLVVYHVWPALMENDAVIMKGEVVTTRGAFWSPATTTIRSRSRSLSPSRYHSSMARSTKKAKPFSRKDYTFKIDFKLLPVIFLGGEHVARKDKLIVVKKSILLVSGKPTSRKPHRRALLVFIQNASFLNATVAQEVLDIGRK
ncbi:mitochondria-eating protein [Gracilinanus agilis]|uniref:mitochondria-eating protein n=1 Tax=Gracilinanus agilis TaxID=191870 RepID=UPI001CFF5006|nr:mitochondria-eating protein [Gracilinanus agilis]